MRWDCDWPEMPRTKAKTWSFVTFGLAAPLEIGTSESESLLHAETCVWVGVGVGFTDVRLNLHRLRLLLVRY